MRRLTILHWAIGFTEGKKDDDEVDVRSSSFHNLFSSSLGP